MSPAQRRVWAHPRVGGENCVDHGAQGVGDGSSPRRRGKRDRLLKCFGFFGLIPA